MTQAPSTMTVSVTNVPAIRTAITFVVDFIDDYAWHTRNCAAVNTAGDDLTGQHCDCGYDEALENFNTLRIRHTNAPR